MRITRRTLAAVSMAAMAALSLSAGLASATNLSGAAESRPTYLIPGLSGMVIAGPGAAVYGYATRIVVITQGSSLAFTNLDQAPHTLTSVDLGPDGEPLFSMSAAPGTTPTTVPGVDKLAPGTYNFYCQFHPNMTGQLIVQGSGGGTKPSPPKYEMPLRVPPVLTGANLTIPVKQADVQMLPHGERTTMFTYGGTYPGPTIRRPAGAMTKVTFVNQLPDTVGAITVHLHGGHQPADSDGQPESQLITAGSRKTYTYPLKDGGKPVPGAFNFYHDHRMGATNRNVWNGLQGMFIVDDPKEAKLGLPTGAADVPLLVADRSFDRFHQLTEPFTHPGDGSDTVQGKFAGPYSPPGDATVGSRILVNGTFQPYFKVDARRYRLRLLNGSGFQSYTFRLSDLTPFVQVGTGSGLLDAPVVRTDILLGPAERADVIVDFSSSYGKKVVLESIARTDNNIGGIGTPTAHLMQFQVTKRVADPSVVPAKLGKLEALATAAVPTMTWTFSLSADPSKGTFWAVNGRPFDASRVDATIPLGSTQTWLLINLSPITHFIHLHEEQWRTVARDGQPPPAWEAGRKDTWRLDPGESVMVAAKITDYTGSFMIHCHMLDHEDHGMMAQFEVVKAGAKMHTLPPAPGTPGRPDTAVVPGLDDLTPPLPMQGMAAMAGMKASRWPASWWCRPANAGLSLFTPAKETL